MCRFCVMHLYLSACRPEFLLKKLQFHLDAHSCKRRRQQQVMWSLLYTKLSRWHKRILIYTQHQNASFINLQWRKQTNQATRASAPRSNMHQLVFLQGWMCKSTMCADATNHTFHITLNQTSFSVATWNPLLSLLPCCSPDVHFQSCYTELLSRP